MDYVGKGEERIKLGFGHAESEMPLRQPPFPRPDGDKQVAG